MQFLNLKEEATYGLGNRLAEVINIVDKLTAEEKKKLISILSESLHKEHKITRHEIIDSVKEKPAEYEIPISVFRCKVLSGLELIVRFLRDEKEMDFSEIGRALNRSPKTIWVTYNNSLKKFKGVLDVSDYSFSIPIKIFRDRKMSVLELIVFYLKDAYGLNAKRIGRMISRDYKTVYTVYYRAKRKLHV